jgi:hypothetical protein
MGRSYTNCTEPANLFFDVPIPASGEKTITVQDYWNGPSIFTSFECVAYAYTGKSSDGLGGTIATFTGTTPTMSTTVDAAAGDTVSVICWQVPPGEGVASVKWNH